MRSRSHSPEFQVQSSRGLFSLHHQKHRLPAGQWITDQSVLKWLWLLRPGKKLYDAELAEADENLWETHKQSPKCPDIFAKDDGVKITTKIKMTIWRQKHLHFWVLCSSWSCACIVIEYLYMWLLDCETQLSRVFCDELHRAQSSGRDLELFRCFQSFPTKFWLELFILGYKKSNEKPQGHGTC